MWWWALSCPVLLESAVEPSLFDLLVAAVDDRAADVRSVFERYASYGDAFNVTHLSLVNFKKFARDCGLIHDQKTDARFGLLFKKSTNRRSGDQARLSLRAFTAMLARIVVDLNPDLSVGSAEESVKTFFDDTFSKAMRMEALPSA